MRKKKFSKSVFTEDIDSRIKQAHCDAKRERKGSAKHTAKMEVLAELQRMRLALIGSAFNLGDLD